MTILGHFIQYSACGMYNIIINPTSHSHDVITQNKEILQ